MSRKVSDLLSGKDLGMTAPQYSGLGRRLSSATGKHSASRRLPRKNSKSVNAGRTKQRRRSRGRDTLVARTTGRGKRGIAAQSHTTVRKRCAAAAAGAPQRSTALPFSIGPSKTWTDVSSLQSQRSYARQLSSSSAHPGRSAYRLLRLVAVDLCANTRRHRRDYLPDAVSDDGRPSGRRDGHRSGDNPADASTRASLPGDRPGRRRVSVVQHRFRSYRREEGVDVPPCSARHRVAAVTPRGWRCKAHGNVAPSSGSRPTDRGPSSSSEANSLSGAAGHPSTSRKLPGSPPSPTFRVSWVRSRGRRSRARLGSSSSCLRE